MHWNEQNGYYSGAGLAAAGCDAVLLAAPVADALLAAEALAALPAAARSDALAAAQLFVARIRRSSTTRRTARGAARRSGRPHSVQRMCRRFELGRKSIELLDPHGEGHLGICLHLLRMAGAHDERKRAGNEMELAHRLLLPRFSVSAPFRFARSKLNWCLFLPRSGPMSFSPKMLACCGGARDDDAGGKPAFGGTERESPMITALDSPRHVGMSHFLLDGSRKGSEPEVLLLEKAYHGGHHHHKGHHKHHEGDEAHDDKAATSASS